MPLRRSSRISAKLKRAADTAPPLAQQNQQKKQKRQPKPPKPNVFVVPASAMPAPLPVVASAASPAPANPEPTAPSRSSTLMHYFGTTTPVCDYTPQRVLDILAHVDSRAAGVMCNATCAEITTVLHGASDPVGHIRDYMHECIERGCPGYVRKFSSTKELAEFNSRKARREAIPNESFEDCVADMMGDFTFCGMSLAEDYLVYMFAASRAGLLTHTAESAASTPSPNGKIKPRELAQLHYFSEPERMGIFNTGSNHATLMAHERVLDKPHLSMQQYTRDICWHVANIVRPRYSRDGRKYAKETVDKYTAINKLGLFDDGSKDAFRVLENALDFANAKAGTEEAFEDWESRVGAEMRRVRDEFFFSAGLDDTGDNLIVHDVVERETQAIVRKICNLVAEKVVLLFRRYYTQPIMHQLFPTLSISTSTPDKNAYDAYTAIKL